MPFKKDDYRNSVVNKPKAFCFADYAIMLFLMILLVKAETHTKRQLPNTKNDFTEFGWLASCRTTFAIQLSQVILTWFPFNFV